MGVLQRFEDRLDRLVNGAFAKAFRSEVQPVEVAAALQRELDEKAAILSRDRTVVPNVFVVELGPSDFDRLGAYSVPLGKELADMVREHADAQQYALVGPPEVSLEQVDDLDTGVFRIRSSSRPGVVAQPRTQAAVDAAPMPAEEAQAAPQVHARLVVNGTAYPLVQLITTVGRGTDVDIRIDDPGVSRTHAAFHAAADGSGYSVVDLASTNGTFMDDERIHERVLSDGMAVRVGSTLLVFRSG